MFYKRDDYTGDVLAVSRRVGKLKRIVEACKPYSGKPLYDYASDEAVSAIKVAQHLFLLLSFGAAIKDKTRQDQNESDIKKFSNDLTKAESSANASYARATSHLGR